MRTTLIALFIFLTQFAFAKEVQFSGAVKNSGNLYSLAGIEIGIHSKFKLIKTIQSNRFGEFKINLEPGEYTVQVKNKAYELYQHKIKIGHQNAYFLILLKEKTVLITTINGAKKPGVHDKTKYKSVHYTTTLGDREEMASEEMVSKRYEKDERVEMGAVVPASMSMITMPSDVVGKAQPNPKAGLLTAGEINDFQKWKLWEDIANETLKEHQKTWKFKPTERYTVQLTNSNDNPVVDATVILKSKDNSIIWVSKTDNTGKAELWHHLNEDSTAMVPTEIEVIYQKTKTVISAIKKMDEGINFLKINTECAYSNIVDIAFVVDATGSMGDEIQYLKEEMQDVLSRVQKQDQQLQINTASVFYKDFGDDYLTKISDFTTSVSKTSEFIKQQNAGGGGDFPEAVDEALATSIRDLKWSTNARARILFLVLDAPPHNDTEMNARVQKLMREAAEKGIKIIPLASSGIDKSTEYLLRCMALSTNGTYTFLTNHSGIGGDHIAPTTDSFKVELVNDLLVRILYQYTFIPECNTYNKKDTVRIDNENPFQLYDVTENMKLYPNPTSDVCNVEIPDATEQLFLTDMSGKILEFHNVKNNNRLQLNLSNYPVGMYFVRCLKNEKWMTEKVMVVR